MSISNILPTEIDLLIIDFLKLQDIINLASVSKYYSEITSKYLEKYHEFNNKCEATMEEYETYVTKKYDRNCLQTTILVNSISFECYNLCEFVFNKYESIHHVGFDMCLTYACNLGKADIVQLVIDNWSKVKVHNFTNKAKTELFKALCKHNYINVLELISPYFDLQDYDNALSYVFDDETSNYAIFEALVAQDNFQINNESKLLVVEKVHKNEMSRAIVILIPYLSHKTTVDVIKKEENSYYEKWSSVFMTPYATNKIKQKKLIYKK